jgi:hypothetical protein
MTEPKDDAPDGLEPGGEDAAEPNAEAARAEAEAAALAANELDDDGDEAAAEAEAPEPVEVPEAAGVSDETHELVTNSEELAD